MSSQSNAAEPGRNAAATLRAGSQSTDESVVVLLVREMREWRNAVERERLDASHERMEAAKERRSERRWRMIFQAAFFGFPIILSLVYFVFFVGWSGFSIGPIGESVGVVKINGEIRSTGLASADKVVPALEKAFSNSKVRAVIVSIDSPGGLPAEAQRIYNAIEALKRKYGKPVMAVINSTGASAAYLIAMHTDAVHASSYSLVGSIGAVMTGWDFHKAMDHLNVGQRVYASGKFKSMLNPFAPNTPEADAKAMALVSGLGGQFVAELHRVRGDRLKKNVDFGSGEVWGGTEAKEIGLVDSISTLEQVIAANWPGLPLHDFGPRAQSSGLLFGKGGIEVRDLIEDALARSFLTLR